MDSDGQKEARLLFMGYKSILPTLATLLETGILEEALLRR